MTKREDPTYLIWSNERMAWWMPGNRGFSSKLTEAGGYSRSAAMGICANAIAGAMSGGDLIMANLPVRLADIQEFIKGRSGDK